MRYKRPAILIRLLKKERKFSKRYYEYKPYNKNEKINLWEDFWQIPDNSYIEASLFSFKYFEEIEEEIKKEITFKEALSGENLELLNDIRKKENSVSIQIRRTDYINVYPDFDVCNLDYYYRSVDYISSKMNNPYFYIFSDDTDWVRENFNINHPYKIVDINDGINAHKDLFLMSNCKHNIIPNSSFGWWGAWLNENPEKLVLCPMKYLKSNLLESDSVFPKNWVRIEN